MTVTVCLAPTESAYFLGAADDSVMKNLMIALGVVACKRVRSNVALIVAKCLPENARARRHRTSQNRF